jgi:hypothetical protein
VTGGLEVAGHLVPTIDTTYDLGASNLRWRDLYLDGETIYLGGSRISFRPKAANQVQFKDVNSQPMRVAAQEVCFD